MLAVRYLVNDVDEAVDFSTRHLGFTLEQQMGPAFAIVVGPGGSQAVFDDPSGNAVELFQPA